MNLLRQNSLYFVCYCQGIFQDLAQEGVKLGESDVTIVVTSLEASISCTDTVLILTLWMYYFNPGLH